MTTFGKTLMSSAGQKNVAPTQVYNPENTLAMYKGPKAQESDLQLLLWKRMLLIYKTLSARLQLI